MFVADLIKKLVEMEIEYDLKWRYDANGEDIMGPLDIHIDVFKDIGDNKFQYAGVSRQIQFHLTEDAVYTVLNAFGDVLKAEDEYK